MARVRVHQHVNPLAKYYREIPVKPLDTASVYEDPAAPLHIDLGCGRGRFLLKMAKERPERNFLGLEIREPLVEDANEMRDKYKARNLGYIFCNAPLDLGRLLSSVPNDQFKLATIQFPDPWFKKRHAKRRMVNEELVRLIAENIADDGRIFVQTDVLELSEEMEDLFTNGGFSSDTIEENILPVKTEREISVEKRGLNVYRRIYTK